MKKLGTKGLRHNERKLHCEKPYLLYLKKKVGKEVTKLCKERGVSKSFILHEIIELGLAAYLNKTC